MLLRIKGRSSFLITAGTAICGGSAIAAISPINGANEEGIGGLGRSGSNATLFLIGTSLSVRTLRQVGVLPLVQEVTL